MDEVFDRPMSNLRTVMKDIPNLGNDVNDYIERQGKDLPVWPASVILPIPAWIGIWQSSVYYQEYQNLKDKNVVGDYVFALNKIEWLAAIGTWRYCKGVYTIDPDVFKYLIETSFPNDMNIPFSVFKRLPEPCVYVKYPKEYSDLWKDSGESHYGFYAFLGYDDRHSENIELHIVYDADPEWARSAVSLTVDYKGSVRDAIISSRRDDGESDQVAVGETLDAIAKALMREISILLYICSDEREIEYRGAPVVLPGFATKKKIKSKYKLFAPPNPRLWVVGEKTGEAIRNYHNAYADPSGKKKAPHIRRAHWHGFYCGPRDAEIRKFIYKWIPPIPVNVDDNNNNDDINDI